MKHLMSKKAEKETVNMYCINCGWSCIDGCSGGCDYTCHYTCGERNNAGPNT